MNAKLPFARTIRDAILDTIWLMYADKKYAAALWVMVLIHNEMQGFFRSYFGPDYDANIWIVRPTISVIFVILALPITVRWYVLLLKSKQAASYLLTLASSRVWQLFFFGVTMFALLFIVPFVFVGLGTKILFSYTGTVSTLLSAIVLVPVYLLISPIIGSRFITIGPSIATGDIPSIPEGFRRTKGNTFRIAMLLLLASLPFGFIYILQSSAIASNSHVWALFFFDVVIAAVQLICGMLMQCLLAIAWKHFHTVAQPDKPSVKFA